MKNAPCKGCEKRHRACHDTCDVYRSWAEKHREMSREAQRHALSEADFFHITNIHKSKRRMHNG